jgi:transposase-like protein
MIMKKTKYQSGFKEQALTKVFARSSDQTVESIATDLNMNLGTLRGWMKDASRDQKNPPLKSAHATAWTPAQRLLALHESHDLEGEALNAWCRERGLFAHDLTKWRSDFCASPVAASRREESDELRQLRQTNQQLQRDLNRKDKALAEAAALLVLQKKYRALWAAEDV